MPFRGVVTVTQRSASGSLSHTASTLTLYRFCTASRSVLLLRAILATKAPPRAGRTRCQTPALLRGLVFGPTGCAMTPTHTRRRGKLYHRYYVSMDVIKQGPDACPVRRVPAGEIEAAVIDQVRALIRTPEIVVRTWRAV